MTTNPTPADHATKPSERIRADASSTLNDFHRVNFARQHEAFAPPHSLTALVVCVQEEVGELAAAVLGYTGEKKRKAHLTRDDVLDAVADAMTYLSLVASNVGCFNLEELLGRTFNMVSTRAGSKLTTGLGQPMQRESVRCLSSRGCAAWTENPSGLCTLHGPANPAAPPSGEVAAPSPVETLDDAPGPIREPDRYQEAIASRFAAGESLASLADDYDLRGDLVQRAIRVTLAYLFDQHVKLTAEPEQAPQAEATPPEPQCGAEYSHCTGGTQRCVLNAGHSGGHCDDDGAWSDDIIRAAEGVTLEPGEYESRSFGRFTVTEPRPPRQSELLGLWQWLVGPHRYSSLVRRVPLTEPEPVPESGGEDCRFTNGGRHSLDPWCDTHTRSAICCLRELRSKVSELRNEQRDLLANLREAQGDLDAARSKVSELERELSQVARDEDGSLVRQGAWNAACCFEESANKRMATDKTKLAELDATLTATEAKLETWKADAKRWRSERDESNAEIDALTPQLATRDAELARVREELADTSKELSRCRSEYAGALRRVADIRETATYHCSSATPVVAAPAVVQREIVVGQTWRGDCGEIDCTGKHVVTDVRMKSGRQSVSFACGDLRIGASAGRFRDKNEPVCVELVRPSPPTAIPRGTTLEVGRWYRITEISRDDPRPAHGVGDVLQCVLRSDFGMPPGTVSAEPISIGGSTPWFAKAIDGGTYVTGLELVPGPVKEQA